MITAAVIILSGHVEYEPPLIALTLLVRRRAAFDARFIAQRIFGAESVATGCDGGRSHGAMVQGADGRIGHPSVVRCELIEIGLRSPFSGYVNNDLIPAVTG
jgi:hypothetical protein